MAGWVCTCQAHVLYYLKQIEIFCCFCQEFSFCSLQGSILSGGLYFWGNFLKDLPRKHSLVWFLNFQSNMYMIKYILGNRNKKETKYFLPLYLGGRHHLKIIKTIWLVGLWMWEQFSCWGGFSSLGFSVHCEVPSHPVNASLKSEPSSTYLSLNLNKTVSDLSFKFCGENISSSTYLNFGTTDQTHCWFSWSFIQLSTEWCLHGEMVSLENPNLELAITRCTTYPFLQWR